MEKETVWVFFFFLSLPCPCPGIFPGNKGCDRISEARRRHINTMRRVQCGRQQQEHNFFFLSSLSCVLWMTWVTHTHTHIDTYTHTAADPCMLDTDTIAHLTPFHQFATASFWWQTSMSPVESCILQALTKIAMCVTTQSHEVWCLLNNWTLGKEPWVAQKLRRSFLVVEDLPAGRLLTQDSPRSGLLRLIRLTPL